MNAIFETIQNRHSVRTFEPRSIQEIKLTALRTYMEANKVGPFGNTVTCRIIALEVDSERELKKYVSYGNIKGARYFLAGSVKIGPHAPQDYGYCMEMYVLKATELGLGTVWLGGSLNRSTFTDVLDMTEEDILPAIVPLGYAAERRSVTDVVIKTMSGGRNRKEFGSLFFLGTPDVPLDKALCGSYADALEAVRLAPSARNLQPWRVIKEKDAQVFHFYETGVPEKTAESSAIILQSNDLGIAMCHFELTAREAGLSGSWSTEAPVLPAEGLSYVASWTGARHV